MFDMPARLRLGTEVSDRHAVGPFWRLWAPLGFAVFIAIAHHVDRDWTWDVFFAEGWGLIELAHFFVPLAASMLALGLFLRLPKGSSAPLRGLALALAAGCFYIAGEEHSWGQHFFGWETPEGWDEFNRQNETNLHNATSWLNHKPRVLLNLFVLFSVVVAPVSLKLGWARMERLVERVRFVLPGRSTHVLGWLVLFYMSWDSLRKAGYLPYISPRDAEMHELYLYAFLLVYVLTLRQRAAAWQAR